MDGSNPAHVSTSSCFAPWLPAEHRSIQKRVLTDLKMIKSRLSFQLKTSRYCRTSGKIMATATMTTHVKKCEGIIGYKFNDPHVLWEALQPPGSGVSSTETRIVQEGNKRLAVLGDVALEIVLCKRWYDGGESRGKS